MRELIFNSFCIASISWLYHIVLRDYILNFWFNWGFRNFGQSKYKVMRWIGKPLFECEICFAGHFALIAYLFNFSTLYEHLLFITFSMLITKLIVKWTN